MINVCFLILHYQNVKDTVNCVDSILKQNIPEKINLQVIIVDNGSPNGSGAEIYEKFKSYQNVETIILEKNFGFSKGNNIGYERALKYSSNIVIASNNDILLEQDNFFENLLKDYQDNCDTYSILCPDIVNLDDFHQNPIRNDYMSLKKAYKNFLYQTIIYILLFIPLLNNAIYKIEKKRVAKWMKNYYDLPSLQKDDGNFVPFGAFIIFLDKWLKKENFAFPSDTFMYMEEDILSLYCEKKQHKMKYVNSLRVRHLEGKSVSESNKNDIDRMKFKLKHQKNALKKYIKFYKKMR